MLKIKLSRTGKRNQPHYRIIVAEARSKRDGKCADIIGHYNPLIKTNAVVVDKDKYNYWISQGALPTDTVKSIVTRSNNL